jgi:hypothetical protein
MIRWMSIRQGFGVGLNSDDGTRLGKEVIMNEKRLKPGLEVASYHPPIHGGWTQSTGGGKRTRRSRYWPGGRCARRTREADERRRTRPEGPEGGEG